MLNFCNGDYSNKIHSYFICQKGEAFFRQSQVCCFRIEAVTSLLILSSITWSIFQVSWLSQAADNCYECRIRNGIFTLKECCAFWWLEMWQLACRHERSFMTNLQGKNYGFNTLLGTVHPNMDFVLAVNVSIKCIVTRPVIFACQKSSEICLFLVVYGEFHSC